MRGGPEKTKDRPRFEAQRPEKANDRRAPVKRGGRLDGRFALDVVPLGFGRVPDVTGHHVRCGDTPLPLQFGTLDGPDLRCSWHGCRYDIRTGKRRDGGTEQLAVLPIAIEDGEIRVAVGVEPALDR